MSEPEVERLKRLVDRAQAANEMINRDRAEMSERITRLTRQRDELIREVAILNDLYMQAKVERELRTALLSHEENHK